MYDHCNKLGLNFSFKLVVVIVQITLGKESIVVLLGQFQINYDLPMMIAEDVPSKMKISFSLLRSACFLVLLPQSYGHLTLNFVQKFMKGEKLDTCLDIQTHL